MSNPGVVLLLSDIIKNHSIKIEDNIGEDIHLHFDDIRFDFSIRNYMDFVNFVKKSTNDMLSVDGFDIDFLGTNFLYYFGDNLRLIKCIKKINNACHPNKIYMLEVGKHNCLQLKECAVPTRDSFLCFFNDTNICISYTDYSNYGDLKSLNSGFFYRIYFDDKFDIRKEIRQKNCEILSKELINRQRIKKNLTFCKKNIVKFFVKIKSLIYRNL